MLFEKVAPIHFCLQYRSPKISIDLQGKLVGVAWKEVGDDEKAKFEKMAEKDKARYEKEMEGYTPPSDDESGDDSDADKKPKAKKAKKDPNAPKKPMVSAAVA